MPHRCIIGSASSLSALTSGFLFLLLVLLPQDGSAICIDRSFTFNTPATNTLLTDSAQGYSKIAMAFPYEGPDTLKGVNLLLDADSCFGQDTVYVGIYFDSLGLPGQSVATRILPPYSYSQYPETTFVDFASSNIIITGNYYVGLAARAGTAASRCEHGPYGSSMSTLEDDGGATPTYKPPKPSTGRVILYAVTGYGWWCWPKDGADPNSASYDPGDWHPITDLGLPDRTFQMSVRLCKPTCYVTGDIDGNGTALATADLAYLHNFLCHAGPAPNPLYRADLNGDGFVSCEDYEKFQCYLSQGMSCFPTYPVPTVCFTQVIVGGDADESGFTDISDAVFLIRYIFAGGPGPYHYPSGDANCDASVDISDAVYVIAYIFSGGPAPGCS